MRPLNASCYCKENVYAQVIFFKLDLSVDKSYSWYSCNTGSQVIHDKKSTTPVAPFTNMVNFNPSMDK